ncbi:hypothetical protein [Microvirga roseola]|uniref:hypothetical protein n=1 Tax=Microvirga roseola TaxID=2883126 RepID=UPI001E32A65A|nr:hypothetical protein [Microvirga roseola]
MRSAVAAVLAYALALQAILFAFGGAYHAVAAPGPQAILCVTNGDVGPDRLPAKAHDGLCCTLSCHGSGPAGPLPAAIHAERLSSDQAVIATAGEAPVFRASHGFLPVGSRAPPRLG